jgi:hypothetical protein
MTWISRAQELEDRSSTSVCLSGFAELLQKVFHIREVLGNRTFQEMQQRGVVDRLGVYKLMEVKQG